MDSLKNAFSFLYPYFVLSKVKYNLAEFDHKGPYGTIRDHKGPYGTIWDCTRPYRIIQENNEPYGNKMDHTRPYRTIGDMGP